MTLTYFTFCMVACVASLGIGCYIIALTVTRTFRDILFFINDRAKVRTERARTTERIKEYIKAHSNMKELSLFICQSIFFMSFSIRLCRIVKEFSELFQPMFMAVFVWCTVSICGAMMMIQIELVKCSCIL